MNNNCNDEFMGYSIVDYEELPDKNDPEIIMFNDKQGIEGDFIDISNEAYGSVKQTMVQPMSISTEKAQELRKSKLNIINDYTNSSRVGRPPKPREPDVSPIDDSFVDLQFEEASKQAFLDRSKIEVIRTDSCNDEAEVERHDSEMIENGFNYDSLNKIEDSFVSISQSDFEGIQDQDDFVNNIKGAFLEHFTNFNYYLNDTGIMAVKKLDFKEEGPEVQLFDKQYSSSRK